MSEHDHKWVLFGNRELKHMGRKEPACFHIDWVCHCGDSKVTELHWFHGEYNKEPNNGVNKGSDVDDA